MFLTARGAESDQRCSVGMAATGGVLRAVLLLCVGTVLLPAAVSGGTPGPCVQTILCLQNFIKDDFHRLKIACHEIIADLDKEGGIVHKDVLYDSQNRCIIWKPGNLSGCRVIETQDDGWKKPVPFTYNCTPASSTRTSPAPVTEGPTLATASPFHAAGEHTRHHLSVIGAVALVLALGLFCCLKSYPMFPQDFLSKPEPRVIQPTNV
ncbi:uncharacterized protein [Engystomops pustulosus]|uniref:uncharacterized protein isoform X2 n=1 Tax=Engystomops pustulosus TaxID=76066 RepID=UPI003AFA7058